MSALTTIGQGGAMTIARDALVAASRLGGYFEVGDRCGPGWAPVDALVRDDDLLVAQPSRSRAALARQRGLDGASIDARVAASVWFLGFVSRIVSPVFGAAVLAGVVPRCTPASVYWSTPGSIAFDDLGGVRGTADELAAAVHEHLLVPVVEPLVSVCRTAFRLSERVLWGNLASAVAGAAIVVAAVRPDQAEPSTDLAQRIEGAGVLAGSGRFTDRGYVRNSCCLIYRLPGSGYCRDCVLPALRP